MNVFDSIRDKALSLFNNSGWVKWIHEGTSPAYTQQQKEYNVEYASKSNHCAKCLNINGCCFPKNNMPGYPLHPNCHCKIVPISNIKFSTKCKIEKFSTNIFNPQIPNGKKQLFEELGYGTIDSEYLVECFCQQAQDKYSSGDFVLNKLDDYGQRININISIPSKNGKTVYTFRTGWMVYPEGEIQLVTVYGGKNK
ncbi:MAG: hypothetical protein NC332_02455 [Firmicutes bacterium]|nr:hypothetical protein [Bacillota bacterium]